MGHISLTHPLEVPSGIGLENAGLVLSYLLLGVISNENRYFNSTRINAQMAVPEWQPLTLLRPSVLTPITQIETFELNVLCALALQHTRRNYDRPNT